ncbi:MAG: hypothetical protein K8F90_02600 [Hyphomicrobiales bacterium]|nr:hypothetical protein [Hyphomicrobiales bacterium]
MKVGDIIRVIKVPAGLRDDGDLRTKTLFDLCLGKTFPIARIDADLIELHVGELLGELSHMHSIYIEPENLEIVEISD